MNENKFSIGMGISVIPINFEFIGNYNRRIDQQKVIDVRLSIGRFQYVPYTSGTIGMLFGQNNKFFEINLGAFYIDNNKINPNDSTQDWWPFINLGHRNVSNKIKIRIGAGFPTLLYVTFSI